MKWPGCGIQQDILFCNDFQTLLVAWFQPNCTHIVQVLCRDH